MFLLVMEESIDFVEQLSEGWKRYFLTSFLDLDLDLF